VQVTSGKDHIMLCTKSGLAVRFEETDVRAMGRPAAGVTGVRFKREGDEVVDMIVVPEGRNEGLKVLTGCANGYGKRTPLEDYPVKGRGTRGVINIDANERNGDVVGAKLVGDADEVMLITSKGILIRTSIAEIRETGRNAAGVRLIKIDEGDHLVAMARVDKEEETEEGTAPAADAPSPDAPPAPDTPTT
jgi:DNA gyrase subunit A